MTICACNSRAENLEQHISPVSNVVSDFKLTVLGSGTPVPSRTQAGAAILVEAGSQRFLFDCGRACSLRLAEYDPALIAKIDKVFLTHLHSDHVVGIPDIWLNGWISGRQEPLAIWGPSGVSALMEGLHLAFAEDLKYRNAGPGKPLPLALQDRITTLAEQGGVVFDAEGVKITAFRVNHAHVPAYGFRVDYNEKAFVISGDTTVSANLVKFGRDADVLLLEVVSPDMLNYLKKTYDPRFVNMILRLHMTTDQASKIFADTTPTLGVYYHTVTGCDTDRALLAQTQKTYNGLVKVARDLMQIQILPNSVETVFLAPDSHPCS